MQDSGYEFPRIPLLGSRVNSVLALAVQLLLAGRATGLGIAAGGNKPHRAHLANLRLALACCVFVSAVLRAVGRTGIRSFVVGLSRKEYPPPTVVALCLSGVYLVSAAQKPQSAAETKPSYVTNLLGPRSIGTFHTTPGLYIPSPDITPSFVVPNNGGIFW